jgi:hypothetical protein
VTHSIKFVAGRGFDCYSLSAVSAPRDHPKGTLSLSGQIVTLHVDIGAGQSWVLKPGCYLNHVLKNPSPKRRARVAVEPLSRGQRQK